MKQLIINLGLVLVLFLVGSLSAQGQEEEVFEYNAGFDPVTGENASIGGFIFPEFSISLVGGVNQDGVSPADLATSEHDPQNDIGVQAIEPHLGINFDDVVTGMIAGNIYQGEEDWEAELEEAFLHYHVNDWLSIGGGQFINRFGFQSDMHIHGWDFVNQNLVNSRLLNEGELITQGGEAIVRLPSRGEITIGGGGVRTHAHGHEEEHGHEDEDEDEEEHHLEADGANFNDWVFSADFRQPLPFDDSTTLSASIATGENGFGQNTSAYGVGLEKLWGGHDHGNGPEFCTGALMLRSELMGRTVEIQDEDGDQFEADDFGISSAIHYGLSDASTLSLRYDWISSMEELELADRHRISPAFTQYLDENQRIHARVQYDYIQDQAIGEEHAAWLQIQVLWGGQGGGRNHQH